MQIALVTLFPEMFAALTEYGITGRAVKQGLLELSFYNPRDYTSDRHQTVDDRPYGGGPGMVMLYQPLKDAINEARDKMSDNAPAVDDEESAQEAGAARVKTLYLSPQGKKLDQAAVERLSCERQLVLVAGRYEGIDERLIDSEIDEEWSIGDYVVSGGELPAMVMIDAMVRLLPGALGHQMSAKEDSFAEGLLDYPHYTRPELIDGMSVPKTLLSGNHEQIRQWRLRAALQRTKARRLDLLTDKVLNAEQRTMLAAMQDQASEEIALKEREPNGLGSREIEPKNQKG